MGVVRNLTRKIFASAEEVAAGEERIVAQRHVGGELIENAVDRSHVILNGIIRSVVFNPELEQVRLEAELYDGSGAIALVWLGRRKIAGVVPGARMSVSGLVTILNGRPIMYNPRYELKAKPGATE